MKTDSGRMNEKYRRYQDRNYRTGEPESDKFSKLHFLIKNIYRREKTNFTQLHFTTNSTCIIFVHTLCTFFFYVHSSLNTTLIHDLVKHLEEVVLEQLEMDELLYLIPIYLMVTHHHLKTIKINISKFLPTKTIPFCL